MPIIAIATVGGLALFLVINVIGHLIAWKQEDAEFDRHADEVEAANKAERF